MEVETPEVQKEARSKFVKVNKYEDPKLYKFVVDKRNENMSWEDITEAVADSGFGKIHVETIRRIYHRAISKSIMIERKTGEKFDDYGKELKVLFGRAIKVLSNQLKALEKMDELLDVTEIEDTASLIKYLKLAPQMNSTIQQIFAAIKVSQDQQDKIREEIKGAVWDDGKLLDRMEIMLENLKKDGWVVIPPKL